MKVLTEFDNAKNRSFNIKGKNHLRTARIRIGEDTGASMLLLSDGTRIQVGQGSGDLSIEDIYKMILAKMTLI